MIVPIPEEGLERAISLFSSSFFTKKHLENIPVKLNSETVTFSNLKGCCINRSSPQFPTEKDRKILYNHRLMHGIAILECQHNLQHLSNTTHALLEISTSKRCTNCDQKIPRCMSSLRILQEILSALAN